MKLSICAVGKLRRGPELDLVTDYLARATKSGAQMGLGPIETREVEDKRNIGMRAEAELLDAAIPKGHARVMLDERGKVMSSPDFSRWLAGQRDQGQPGVAFVIGGADGLEPGFRTTADLSLSFGKMVWPHMLVRVMLAEQIYRAVSILAGAPYHRS